MSSSDEEKIKALIPAEFHMISGSHDVQTSADVFNVNKVRYFQPVAVLIQEEITKKFLFMVAFEYSVPFRIAQQTNESKSLSYPIPRARRVVPAQVHCYRYCTVTNMRRHP
jgi:hypothetical protein